jgi:hypothetical protein
MLINSDGSKAKNENTVPDPLALLPVPKEKVVPEGEVLLKIEESVVKAWVVSKDIHFPSEPQTDEPVYHPSVEVCVFTKTSVVDDKPVPTVALEPEPVKVPVEKPRVVLALTELVILPTLLDTGEPPSLAAQATKLSPLSL